MEKINVAELLKDCPKGMELDCAIFENLEFDHINKDNGAYNIICRVKSGCGYYNTHTFTEYGCYGTEKYSKCVIFPKGKTTWEGFHRPFKDGDIVFTHANCLKVGLGNTWISIFQEKRNGGVATYVDYAEDGSDFYADEDKGLLCMNEDIMRQRLATEEEKEKLFKAIKDNSYKWNEENKTLEKFVVPKFKVGDRIKNNNTVLTIITVGKNSYIVEDNPDNFGILMFSQQDKWELNNGHKFKVGDRIKQKGSPRSYIISSIEYDRYRLNNNQFIRFTDEHIYELVPNKFDITTLKPFDKVLVRCNTLEKWRIQFFEKYDKTYQDPFICMGYNKYKQCIPYEGNEHLLDTADNCDEYYKTWK